MSQILVAKWGNSLAFRLPQGIANDMRIKAGDALELTPSEDGLLVKKAIPPMRRGKRYALSDVLNSFAPAGTHAEVDFGGPKGEELW